MGRSKGRAHSSKAGCSAPVIKQERKLCVYCSDTVIKKSELLIKGNLLYGYVCANCGETESFTMADLQKMTGADLATLKKCESLKKYTLPEGSDGSDVLVGFFEFKKCGICQNLLKKGDNVRDHNNECHDAVQICSLGCKQFVKAENFEKHQENCGIFCPKCKEIPSTPNNDYRQHFMNELKDVFACPADGCCKAFLREDLDQICQHLLLTHMWISAVKNQQIASPVNKRRRKE
ncbi:Hypothetical predicted protein [Cloeon dipterum]|uniref:TRAF-type domain-containing protein n=1 Tax=Cloeon dipterum TaxID=197152 RepID=A0A8S1DKF9_9INSE|nr:Hypothetical predicted protein [Cloeon dipterum]